MQALPFLIINLYEWDKVSTYKQGFLDILSGNFESAREIFNRLAHHRQLDGVDYKISLLGNDDKLTLEGLNLFCENYPLKKENSSILLRAHENMLNSNDEDGVTIMKKLLLLSDDNKLTPNGYFKLVESSSLKNQIDLLEIDYTESIFEKIPGASSESYVMSRYEKLGYHCRHDEGGSIQHLMQFSLLNEIDILKDLLSNVIHIRDNKFFEISHNLGAFRDQYVDGTLQFRDESKQALLNIYKKTTRERIINGHRVRSDVAQKAREFAFVSEWELEPALRVFDALGIENFVTLAKFKLDNYDRIWGWPDIIAIRGKEVLLIEVKRTDKLSFKQACTLSELKKLTGFVFSGVCVERVILK